MGLLQVATNTISSATDTVTLTGINTDDVYMVAYNNVFCSANDDIGIRVTTSGTPDSDSEYDYASKDLTELITVLTYLVFKVVEFIQLMKQMTV
jgi:hypothetical protein